MKLNRLVFSIMIMQMLLIGSSVAARPTSTDSIHESRYLSLGGIEQFISIHGDSLANPMLLVIHGGPGDILSPYVEEFRCYENNFTVVQWDQRGAGRTYIKNMNKTYNLNLSRVAKDGVELAHYLHEQFNIEDIVLLGHSWGTLIAAEMAKMSPELFTVYVGIGQMSSGIKSNQAQYDFLVRMAKENPDLKAELDAFGEFDANNPEHGKAINPIARRCLNKADANWISNLKERNRRIFAEEEFQYIVDGMIFSANAYRDYYPDLFDQAPKLSLPVIVIQGEKDIFTPTKAAEKYFKFLDAPEKKMFTIEDAGHFVLVTHADKVVKILRSSIYEIIEGKE